MQIVEDENLQVEPQPPYPNSMFDTINNLEHYLSFNALKGSSGVGTMTFQGSINGMMIQVLLDNGSSDNFLQPRLASCLKLPIDHPLIFMCW